MVRPEHFKTDAWNFTKKNMLLISPASGLSWRKKQRKSNMVESSLIEVFFFYVKKSRGQAKVVETRFLVYKDKTMCLWVIQLCLTTNGGPF